MKVIAEIGYRLPLVFVARDYCTIEFSREVDTRCFGQQEAETCARLLGKPVPATYMPL